MALRLATFAGAASLCVAQNLSTLRANLLTSYVLTSNLTGADSDVASWLPLIQPNGTFSVSIGCVRVSHLVCV